MRNPAFSCTSLPIAQYCRKAYCQILQATFRAHTTCTKSPILLIAAETKLMVSTTRQKFLYYYCFITKLPPVLKLTCYKDATFYCCPPFPQASDRISLLQHNTSNTTINSTQEDLAATRSCVLTFKIQKAPLTGGLISGTNSQHTHWPSALSYATCRRSLLCP